MLRDVTGVQERNLGPMCRGATMILLCAAWLLLAFSPELSGGTVTPRVVEQGDFAVIGIPIRTNNTAGDIPKQRERLFKEGVLAGRSAHRY